MTTTRLSMSFAVVFVVIGELADMESGVGRRPGVYFLFVVEICIIALFQFFAVGQGELHVDEAGYIYNSSEIAKGRQPYHDFFFLQTPVFPYVFALAWTVFEPDFVKARGYMALFGLSTAVLSMIIAYRVSGQTAALLTGLFFILTPFQLRFFSIARMFPLATFWLCAGVVFMTGPSRSVFRAVMAMVFFALAFASRLTLLPVPFLFCIYLIFCDGIGSRRLWWGLMGGTITTAVVVLPFLIPDQSRFIYNIIGFHLDLTVGGFFSGLVHKAAGFSRLVMAYFVVILASVFSMAIYFTDKTHSIRTRMTYESRLLLLFMVAVVIVVGGGHFTAKFFQESYQTIVFPFLAIVSAVVIGGTREFGEKIDRVFPKSFISLLVCIVLPLGIIANGARGFVWSGEQKHVNLKTAAKRAEYLASISGPDDVILCSDSPLLPFLAKRRIMIGFEGPEYFPLWDEERARHYRVVNQSILLDLIKQQVPDIILVNSQSFALIMPTRRDTPVALRQEIFSAFDAHYTLLQTFPSLFTPGESEYFYMRPALAIERGFVDEQ